MRTNLTPPHGDECIDIGTLSQRLTAGISCFRVSKQLNWGPGDKCSIKGSEARDRLRTA